MRRTQPYVSTSLNRLLTDSPWWIRWMVSAKNWFTGPRVQGTAEELAEAERDIELAGGAA